MAAKRNPNSTPSRRSRPATTIEGRESQLIALAVDLAEQQLRDGTASSQVITHYLKLGSTREQFEQQRLKGEIEVLKAKTDAMASAQRVEELFDQALIAMREYKGTDTADEQL